MMRWTQRMLVGVLALLLVLTSAAVVSAHAALIGSEPADGAVLERAPERVRLFFSEPIEREFFALGVYIEDRQRVDRHDAHIPPDNVAALEATLPPLGSGTYTVVWRVLSIDGHVVRGAYAFSVGAATAKTVRVLDVEASGAPVALAATVRWLTYLAAFVLVGGLGFLPLVLSPAVRAVGVSDPAPVHLATRGWVWSAWLALVALFGLSLGAVVLQAADATGVPLAEVFSGRALTRLLMGTKYGVLWMTRMGLLLGLLTVVTVLTVQARPSRWLHWIGLGFGAGVLLTISAAGHASAVPRQTMLAIAMDWLHLVAGAVWVGGLVQLVLALPPALHVLDSPGRRTLLARVVRRFSWVAGLSVAGLVATGMYAGLIHVPSWQALVDTVYGAVLAGKLILIVPLLALGAVNLLVLGPYFVRAALAQPGTRQPPVRGDGKRARSRRGGPSESGGADDDASFRFFRRIVLGEISLVVLVLAVTGILAGVPPATADVPTGQPFTETQHLGDLRVTLTVTPNYVGTNQLEVALTDAAGQPVAAEAVVLTLHHLDMDMGQREVQADPAEPGRFHARGNFLSMAGTWQADVRVQRPDHVEQTTTFQFTLGQAPGSNRPAISPLRILRYAITPTAALGVTALLLAILVLQSRMGTRQARARRQELWIGVVLLAIGLFAVGNALATGYRMSRPSPVPATAESLAQGQEIYTQHCVSCHGVSGQGDGPAAFTMNPRPANLQMHLQQGHTDTELYSWIAHGIDGTGMPAFEDTLSEEEMWHVVNYIKTFAPTGQEVGTR